MTDEERTTTIQVRVSIRDKLVKLKIHPREPIGEVIERLLGVEST